jgi:hypothetical protein
MKTTKLFFAFLLLVPLAMHAQNAGVDAALQKGNAADLSPHFAKMVDLVILGDESSVNGKEATTILADFFSKKIVKGYAQSHFNAAQNGRSTHTIGELTTANGTYRISIFYDATKKISEIRIE